MPVLRAAIYLYLVAGLAAAAPIPIRSVDTTLILGSPSSAAGFTFQGNQLKVDYFYIGTPGVDLTQWKPIQAPPTVSVLRYGTTRPDRDLGWVALNSGSTLHGIQPPTTAQLIARNDLHLAVDNVFVNATSEANSTNIERVDFIFAAPVSASSTRSVVVLERGATAGHDAFSIAAILAVDANGNPTQYGPVVRVALGWANNAAYTLSTGNGQVFYRDPAGPLVSSATITGQVIAGLMIPLTDMTSLGTAVYGYSLFGSDVPLNGDLTRPDLFPRTTPSSGGGMDLVAMNVGVVQEVPEPVTLMTAGAALLGLGLLRRLGFAKRNRIVK